MQVSTLSMALIALNIVFALALPVVLLILCKKSFGGSLVPFFTGAVTFFLAAMVLESILHNIVLLSPVGQVIQNNVFLYALYGGLAAGLFEETGRLAAMKWLKKKHNRPETALLYGAGHGGIEVLLLLGMTMANNLVLSFMINAGQTEVLSASMDGANLEALQATFRALAETPATMYLMAPLERISAVILHISLSILVWQAAVKPGKMGMYFLAVLLHALVDGAAVILQRMGVPALLLELILLLSSLGIARYAASVYRDSRPTEQE